jgi:tetratricopeptide (TPR) repeat protein
LAQPGQQEQLANQYLENREYDKAAELYRELFDRNPSPLFFQNYLKCAKELGEKKEAEKFIRKAIKKSPGVPDYVIELGVILKEQGETEKAEKQFEEALSAVVKEPHRAYTTAMAFVRAKEPDYAIKTYMEARKSPVNGYPFFFEIADVYMQKDDFASALKEYLDAIAYNEMYQSQVQNLLQQMVGDDPKSARSEELRKQVLKRIQSQPDMQAYSEMLIWFFLQQKDYEAAFSQSKAFDKRNRQTSGKVMSLAAIALSNEEYDLAIKCFEHEVSLGASNPNFTYARMELVKALNQKITGRGNYQQSDLLLLRSKYQSAISDLGKSSKTLPLMRGLAHLYAFYLNQPDSALDILDEALTYTQADQNLIAECKLEKADVLLFTGEMWECSLLYSQVEKAFKMEPIGQEAKYRNARLSFYKSEFEWAQAQLDVLKASTSKLIANDALYLSLLIIDNNPDSNTVPLSMFARAMMLEFQNLDSLAALSMDSIHKEFPGHVLSDDILMKKYQIAMKHQQFTQAAGFLEELRSTYGEDILGDDATFKLAELCETRLSQNDKARELYQEVLSKYPGSLYTVEARKRFRKLRGDQFN